MIYGVAILAGCTLVGSFIGNLIGMLIGLGSDVGGVGFAMILLLLITNSQKTFSKFPKGTSEGLTFWKEMFLPVVIAMSMTQNVYQALSSGIVAFTAGLAAVVAAFLLLPVLNKMTKKSSINADDKEESSCNK